MLNVIKKDDASDNKPADDIFFKNIVAKNCGTFCDGFHNF